MQLVDNIMKDSREIRLPKIGQTSLFTPVFLAETVAE